VTLLLAAIPFISWFAVVVVSLVCLRKGVSQSLPLLLWALLPVLTFGAYHGEWEWAGQTIVLSYVLPWLLAVVLRMTARWSLVCASAVLLALATVMLIGLVYPDNVDSLVKLLQAMQQAFYENGLIDMPTTESRDILQSLAPFIPGVQASFVVIAALIKLMFARQLQAILYRPGGFRREILALRVNPLFVLLMVSAVAGVAMNAPLAKNVLGVCLLPLVIHGVTLLHWFVAERHHWHLAMVTLMYVLMVGLIPYSLLPLLALSVVDMVVDFRELPRPKLEAS